MENESSWAVATLFTQVSFDTDIQIADGTQITSNAPITVVSGSLCENYGNGMSGSLISNIPPVGNLASSYMVPYLMSQNVVNPGFYLTVVAVEDNTVVEFDGDTVTLPSVQGCHSQGKSQGKKYFFKIMEKSWNFVTSQ